MILFDFQVISAYFMFFATLPHNRSKAKQKKTCKNANVARAIEFVSNPPFDTRPFFSLSISILVANWIFSMSSSSTSLLLFVAAYDGGICEDHRTCIISITVMALPSIMRIIHVKWHTMYTTFFSFFSSLLHSNKYVSCISNTSAPLQNRCAMNSVFDSSIYCQSINLNIYINTMHNVQMYI